jgi:hypothetical protein
MGDKMMHGIPKEKIKVLCLSDWYPLSMSRYWENAFKRNPNIDFKNCGAYTGSWIPWLGGMSVLEKYAKPPTIVTPFKPNVRVPYALVKAQLGSWIPDLVITINAGADFVDKPTDGFVASVGTDGHCLDYTHSRNISDKFFNMHPKYAQGDDVLLHYAFDPDVHYPMTEIEKDTDAVLIGMPYQQRVDWVNKLRSLGVSVLFENGPIFDEYRELNNRAKLGLNWSSLGDLNARVFELMAMKLCPIIDRCDDLERFGFKEGHHYLGFDNLDEAVLRVQWALNSPHEAEEIALAAYNKVNMEDFTYDALVSKVLKEFRLDE